MFFYLVWCWIFICFVNAQDIQPASFSKEDDTSIQVPAGTRALLSLSYAGGKTDGPFLVVELNGVRVLSRAANLPALQGMVVPFSLTTFNKSLVGTSLAKWIAFLDCDGPRKIVEQTIQSAVQLGAGAALVYTAQGGGGYCQFDIASSPSPDAPRIPIYTLIDRLTGTIPKEIQAVQTFYQTQYPAGLNVTTLDKMARSAVVDLARLNSGQARNTTTAAVLARVYNEDSVSSDPNLMFMEPDSELERERPSSGGTRGYRRLSQSAVVLAGTLILSSFLAI